LSPRARALARFAVTLTAQPWALDGETVSEARRHGLDEKQVEAATAVISMFNYFTRVADASGIEFDYVTPLPAFEPDTGQVPASRPRRLAPSDGDVDQHRRQPRNSSLQAAWETWRSYVMGTEHPISRRERHVLAVVASEECADWEGAEMLGGPGGVADGDEQLVEFARKLSRQPWTMVADDLANLRRAGYTEEAVLHIISVVAHQNADSRLAAGLKAARECLLPEDE
jgi:alkylhydroperoxidase family enzyme